jgi:hypothetical protein
VSNGATLVIEERRAVEILVVQMTNVFTRPLVGTAESEIKPFQKTIHAKRDFWLVKTRIDNRHLDEKPNILCFHKPLYIKTILPMMLRSSHRLLLCSLDPVIIELLRI